MSETSTKAPRREQVRALRAAGLSPREIAAAMHISTQAVYKHLAKLDAEPERESVA